MIWFHFIDNVLNELKKNTTDTTSALQYAWKFLTGNMMSEHEIKTQEELIQKLNNKLVCSHNVVLCALRGGRIKGVRRISLQNHIF